MTTETETTGADSTDQYYAQDDEVLRGDGVVICQIDESLPGMAEDIADALNAKYADTPVETTPDVAEGLATQLRELAGRCANQWSGPGLDRCFAALAAYEAGKVAGHQVGNAVDEAEFLAEVAKTKCTVEQQRTENDFGDSREWKQFRFVYIDLKGREIGFISFCDGRSPTYHLWSAGV